MRILTEVLSSLYSWVLCLYPRRFREQFADEMQAVFERVLNDSRSAPGQFLVTVWREFGSLLPGLLREYWRELTRATHGLTGYIEDERPSSWPEALLTALPFGLVLLVSLVQFGAYTFQVVLGLALIAVIVAWRKNWPRWSVGWIGLMLFVLILYLINSLAMFGNEWNTPKTLLARLSGEVLLPVGLGMALYASYQRDTVKGMLIALFLLDFTNPFGLEFVPEPLNTITTAGTQIVVVLTAIWLARRGRRMTGVGLLIGASILIGLALSITSEYGNSFTSYKPQAVDVVRGFLPNMLSVLTLLIGPLLLRAVWDLGRRSGRAGVLGHWLALLGLALMLVGEFGSYRLFLPDDLTVFRESVSIWFTGAIWGGAALYIGGLALTGFAAKRSGLPLNIGLYSLVAILLFAAPLVFQLPGIISTRALPALVPGVNDLTYIRQLPDLLALTLGSALGLMWLALGAVVIALLSHKTPTMAAE